MLLSPQQLEMVALSVPATVREPVRVLGHGQVRVWAHVLFQVKVLLQVLVRAHGWVLHGGQHKRVH